MHRRWTQEEISYLKNNYHLLSTREMSIFLNRTIQTIHTTAYNLGLNKHTYWTEDKIIFLKNNYGSIHLKDISKHLNLSSHILKTKIIELGLNKNKKFIDYDHLLKTHPCIYCKNELTLNNINFSRLKRRHYVCSPCITLRYRNTENYKQKRFTNITKIHNRSELEKVLVKKFQRIKKCAIERNINFSLSRDEVINLTKNNCYLCDKPSTIEAPNGLDRLDNNKGYVLDNVLSCCKYCNFGKNILTGQEYIDHCKKVIDFQALKIGK